MDEDRTYVDGLCVSGEDDKCGSHGDAISTIYPMRSEIKAALAAWNPAWAAKVNYACEPPTAVQAPCGTGCQFCKAGAVGDCVPENVNCATIDALPTFTKETVCGERLSTTTVPRRSTAATSATPTAAVPQSTPVVARHAPQQGPRRRRHRRRRLRRPVQACPARCREGRRRSSARRSPRATASSLRRGSSASPRRRTG